MTFDLPLTAYELVLLATLAGLAGLAVVGRIVLTRAWRRDSPARRCAASVLLATVASGLALVSAEAGFYLFGAHSQSIDFTLAAGRWYEEHWKPVNSQGFRDVEPADATLAATRRLVVLGDSIAAGHGIDRTEDRFADRLRRALGPSWSVVLLAKPGWGTGDEVAALRGFPRMPHAVVLAWYVNDVEGAARRHGVRFSPDLSVRPAWLAAPVGASHLANFVYWRLWWRREGPLLGLRFERFLEQAFGDPAIWEAHRAELEEVVGFSRAVGAQLVVLAFPELRDVARSRTHTARVAELFRSLGADTIDLGEAFAGRRPEDLCVSPVDAHPNAAVHAEVAERVLARLRPPRR